MPALKLVPNAVQYSKVIENIICGAGMAPLFDIYQDMLKKRPKMSCNLGRIIFWDHILLVYIRYRYTYFLGKL